MSIDASYSTVAFEYSDLYARYNITSRQGLLDRIKFLEQAGIPVLITKRGRKKFVASSTLQWLDDLHEHLQSGGRLAGFVPNLSQESQTKHVNSFVVPNDDGVEEIAKEITQGIQIRSSIDLIQLASAIAYSVRKPQDPYSNYKQLEEIYQNGWHISSQNLRELINRSLAHSGGEIAWGGFKAIRVKRGWWKIQKDLSDRLVP